MERELNLDVNYDHNGYSESESDSSIDWDQMQGDRSEDEIYQEEDEKENWDFGIPEKNEPRKLGNRYTNWTISSIERALGLNVAMRQHLLELEVRLVKKLKDLAASRQRTTNAKGANDPEITASDQFYRQFATPYFKVEGNETACPPNADTTRKLANRELITCRLVHKKWKTKEVEALLEVIEGEGTTCRGDTDWDDLSTKLFGGYYTAEECKKLWHLCLRPNQAAWTEEEVKKLVTVAERHGYRDWATIADELGTSRSMLQCFLYFQTFINGRYNEGKWSKKEDELLTKVVAKCTYGRHVSWPKVAYYLENRSYSQIYIRWNNCLRPSLKKQRFTEEEDRKILEGVYELGLDWREIAATMGGRNAIQVRERLEYQLKPQLNLKMGEWTIEEDERLLRLVDEFGTAKWAQIAGEFGTRNRVQIRHRYNRLMMMKNQPQGLDLKRLRRWKRGNSRVRAQQNKDVMENIAKRRKIEQ